MAVRGIYFETREIEFWSDPDNDFDNHIAEEDEEKREFVFYYRNNNPFYGELDEDKFELVAPKGWDIEVLTSIIEKDGKETMKISCLVPTMFYGALTLSYLKTYKDKQAYDYYTSPLIFIRSKNPNVWNITEAGNNQSDSIFFEIHVKTFDDRVPLGRYSDWLPEFVNLFYDDYKGSPVIIDWWQEPFKNPDYFKAFEKNPSEFYSELIFRFSISSPGTEYQSRLYFDYKDEFMEEAYQKVYAFQFKFPKIEAPMIYIDEQSIFPTDKWNAIRRIGEEGNPEFNIFPGRFTFRAKFLDEDKVNLSNMHDFVYLGERSLGKIKTYSKEDQERNPAHKKGYIEYREIETPKGKEWEFFIEEIYGAGEVQIFAKNKHGETQKISSNWKGFDIARKSAEDNNKRLDIMNWVPHKLKEGSFGKITKVYEDILNILYIDKNEQKRISLLEKINRISEMKDPKEMDIKYFQSFADEIGWNINLTKKFYDLMIAIYKNQDGSRSEDSFYNAKVQKAGDLIQDSMIRNLLELIPFFKKNKISSKIFHSIFMTLALAVEIKYLYTETYGPRSKDFWKSNGAERKTKGYNTGHFIIEFDAMHENTKIMSESSEILRELYNFVLDIKPFYHVFSGFEKIIYATIHNFTLNINGLIKQYAGIFKELNASEGEIPNYSFEDQIDTEIEDLHLEIEDKTKNIGSNPLPWEKMDCGLQDVPEIPPYTPNNDPPEILRIQHPWILPISRPDIMEDILSDAFLDEEYYAKITAEDNVWHGNSNLKGHISSAGLPANLTPT